MHLISRVRYFFVVSFILILFFSFNRCKESNSNQKKIIKNSQSENFGIVIHGGAGTMSRKEMTKEMDLIYRKKLEINN